MSPAKNRKEKYETVRREEYELPVWEIGTSVVLPLCKEYIEIKEYTDLELLGASRKYEGRVFVMQSTHNEYVPSDVFGLADIIEKYDSIKIGTVCEIKDIIRNDDDSYDAVLIGISRAVCVDIRSEGSRRFGRVFCLGEIEPETDAAFERCKIFKKRILQMLKQYSKSFFRVVGRSKSSAALSNIENLSEFSFKAAQFAEFEPFVYAYILRCDSLERRLEKITAALYEELQYLSLSDRILEDVQRTLSKQQKEMFLREQMRSIQRELGDDEASEADIMTDRLNELAPYMSSGTAEKIMYNITKLRRMQSMSPDYQVLRSHVDFLLDLPWEKPEQEEISLSRVREILDRDHYAMDKVKQRIVEYMAVKTMKNATARSIICLFGPPGTGKTSVVKSIAEALGRKYVRISLGGVHDEAEIRGHRKTYVGAMPGRILTAIKNAGTRNPVVLLDEIDKMNTEAKGDPASALLEVLDKEQNNAFRDNYAEVPFDLSEVLFITTANSLDTVPEPLKDRLEIIELTSYTESEKFEIAKRHLIPAQIAEHGLKKSSVAITDGAVLKIINGYTCEAGVRQLEREIASLMRKTICILREQGKRSYRINEARVEEMLGACRTFRHFDTSADSTGVGSVYGMAWSPVGGHLLPVDVNVLDGSGRIETTGLIGDVMRESAQAALSYIRSRSAEFNLPRDFYRTKDVHLHVPEGATKKDGPSAGVTITTAMFSALTGIPVKKSVAMTGEVTIRGEVLAIGGLKEKSLAALKAGISTIIVPANNHSDVLELPEAVKNGMNIVEVKNIDEVFAVALANDGKQ